MCAPPCTTLQVCEVIGQDSKANLKDNCGPVLEEIQQLMNQTASVQVEWGNRMWTFTVEMAFPADMKAHWSCFGAGGASANFFCHRCTCLTTCRYDVFQVYITQHGDTIAGIAHSCGTSTDELRVINTALPDRETDLIPLHSRREQQSWQPLEVRFSNEM